MHVLAPVDGSESAAEALEYALVRFPGATVTVLYVSDLASGQQRIAAGGTFESWRSEQETFADDLFDAATERATDHGRAIETAHEFGDPMRVIVEYAEANDVDLIVVGYRGRDAVSRMLLGSVAEGVVRRAHVPVLVVR